MKDTLYCFYIKDVPKVLQMAYDMRDAGDYPRFFRNWFDEKISADLIEDGRQSSQILVNDLLELMQGPEKKGNICITHDWNVVLLKKYYLGQRPEEYGHIEFLEGVIIYEWSNSYYITNCQSEAKRLEFS